jgi:hypothetical protein
MSSVTSSTHRRRHSVASNPSQTQHSNDFKEQHAADVLHDPALAHPLGEANDPESGDAEEGRSEQHFNIMQEMHTQLRAASRVVSSLKDKIESLTAEKTQAEAAANDLRARLASTERARDEALAALTARPDPPAELASPSQRASRGPAAVSPPGRGEPPVEPQGGGVSGGGEAVVAAATAAAEQAVQLSRSLARHKRELELSTLRCAALQADARRGAEEAARLRGLLDASEQEALALKEEVPPPPPLPRPAPPPSPALAASGARGWAPAADGEGRRGPADAAGLG